MSHWVKLRLKLATQDSQDLLDTQVSVAEVAWGGLQRTTSQRWDIPTITARISR